MEWFIIGFLVGGVVVTIALVGFIFKPIGTLRVDRRNPEKDIYRFDLGDNLERSINKSRITLRVDSDADLSQK